jgi:hypothetical protein
MSTHMSDKEDLTVPRLPVSNYSSAVARAVAWLGDRYLLARPINTPTQQRQSSAPAIDTLASARGMK